MAPKTQLDRIEERLDGIHDLIHGTGSEDPGMKTQLDRLVQSERRRTWLARTAVGAAFAALFASVSKVFHA